ncbi:thiamine pyrophosphate-dependent enzyme [Sphingoaurantiacus capsulatus]|uniref:Thiamine pyrophosphate-dependent enzyme n=1 Tax=Sphingoaurantiacus capsulatus TaxID=1771310 RepID=A0ABV7X9U8_9SPHN
MAERSFTKEIDKLRLGSGEEFNGEGILAVTKALLESGVSYVGGYQGAPISHLLDVLSDARDILADTGIEFVASSSEAAAAAMLGVSATYPLRGAVAWKSTVGTNVASDALANLASTGVTGGALIILGEDYGEGSSIMQERTHAFAMKSQVWLLDPRPNLPSIVKAVKTGFELSEASRTPVMLTLRIRACHLYGRFTCGDNVRPAMTMREAMEETRDFGAEGYTGPPHTLRHEQEKIHSRFPAALDFIRREKLNEIFDGPDDDLGIIVQGGMYNNLIRALTQLDLCDVFGASRIPIYVLNVTYPLCNDEVEDFCRGKRSVLVVEEGQPEFIEEAVRAILHKSALATTVMGKGELPRAGEYSVEVIRNALAVFAAGKRPNASRDVIRVDAAVGTTPAGAAGLAQNIAPRSPSLCTGCPERPVFTAMKMLRQELGHFHVSGDIGCNGFVLLPPFGLGQGTFGYGLSAASASALPGVPGKRSISVMGDGGFWHNGLSSGVVNAIYNKSDNVILVVDNDYSAATGGQDIPSTRATNIARSTKHDIGDAVRGVGVNWVREVTSYDIEEVKGALRDALTTEETGLKVVIATSECMLNRQRREKQVVKKKLSAGQRVVRQKFGVDAETCTGDRSCMRLSGCPSLGLRDNPDPLKREPVVHVEESCVGCGHCGEVAHAAVLCPSFYRLDIVTNECPSERWRARLRRSVIGFLQRRIEPIEANAS